MSAEQSNLRAELYRRYLAALSQLTAEGKMMPYDWGRLPESLPFPWIIYSQMFMEYAIEIANAVNNLTNHVARIRAWDLVLPSLSNHDRMEALNEFIQPIAVDALSLPYAIRSRFIFAIAHLCHQANLALPNFQWSDDLPEDEKIGFKEAKKYGRHWSAFPRCKDTFEKIFKGDFQVETLDFRHSHNHRFAPHVVMGLSGFVVRKKDAEGNWQYALGSAEPLGLKYIADAIIPQCQYCYDAFEAFQALVAEHEAAIMKTMASS